MKFRNKPVVVEAEQWWPGRHVDGVCYCASPSLTGRCDAEPGTAHLHTLEGGHVVSPGDWIITVMGERYPCKPDIFGSTYEAVDPHDVDHLYRDEPTEATANP